MTKDEAIKKAREGWTSGSSETWLVNALEQLGVLKLDEPKTISLRLAEAISDWKLKGGYIMDFVDAAGLRIVEK